MTQWQNYLERWQQAGLVDAATAARIHDFEATEARPAGARWQVLIALILGGMLLAAGILLFVAAHWEELSPGMRLFTVMGILAGLHGVAVAATERFPAFATTLHGVGTVAAGGAIAMVGQIFNMQEHWPAAVMLWAICAASGWWLLGDQFQEVCTLLLVPAWVVCEWMYRALHYTGNDVYLTRILVVMAAVYLTAFVHARRGVVFGILFAVAAVALVIGTGFLSEGGWTYDYWHRGFMPAGLQLVALALMVSAAALGWWRERHSIIPVATVFAMTFVLPWLRTTIEEKLNGYAWPHSEPSVVMYAAVASVAVVLAWWGVREHSQAVVNFAVVAFAMTVMWFYFSSLMDKFGRSLGLIGLGVVFLAGGWLLERVRRRLIAEAQTGTYVTEGA